MLVHDVGWLDVPVHHVLAMGVSQSLRDPRHDGQHPWHRQQVTVLAVVEQVFALEKLHRDIRQIMLLASIEYGDDVLVLQTAGGFSLAEKALARINQLVAREFLGQGHGLDRDDATDFRILAQIHDAHRTLAQFLVDLIAPQHWFFDRSSVEQHGAARM